MWGRNWCCLGICALALGLAIFIVAIFPVGFLMFLVALLLVVCGCCSGSKTGRNKAVLWRIE